MKPLIVYTAGPYRSKCGEHYVWENCMKARDVAAKLLAYGFAPICPHMNTLMMGGAVDGDPAKEHEIIMAADLAILERCDAVYLLPGWPHSSGARQEKQHAESLGIPCFENINRLLAWRETWTA